MTSLRLAALLLALSLAGLASAQPGKPPTKPAGSKPAASKPAAKPPAKPQGMTVTQLSQEVQALTALGDLDLQADQLKELAKLAAGAAAEPGDAQAGKISDALQKCLKDLHAALAKGDEEKAVELRGKFDELTDKEEPEFGDDYEATDVAKKRVGQAIKLLTVRQLGGYIAGLELQEPHEMLMEAFEDVRGKTGDARTKQIQQTADDVAQMLFGENNPQAAKTKEQVKKLLEEAAGLKDDEFDKKFPGFEKRAKAIVGQADCLRVLRHIMERELAKLLSNPRLSNAIELRMKFVDKE